MLPAHWRWPKSILPQQDDRTRSIVDGDSLAD
jgi:hypothetical protein